MINPLCPCLYMYPFPYAVNYIKSASIAICQRYLNAVNAKKLQRIVVHERYRGHPKRAFASAMVISVGNVGGAIDGQGYRTAVTRRCIHGLVACFGLLFGTNISP